MENYKIYRNLKSEITKKKVKLSELKKHLPQHDSDIEKLEISIEEDIHGLNMVFDYLISHKRS